MFCRLLTFSMVLLSLLVFCALSVPTCSALSTAKAEIADLFTPDGKTEITDVLQPDKKEKIKGEGNIILKNITAPFLFAVDDVMVSVTEGNYTDEKPGSGKEKVDLVAKYIKSEKNNVDWGKTLIEKFTTAELKTQLATQNQEVAKGFSVLRAAVLSAKNKIYFLAVNNTQTDTGELSAASSWKFTLVEGTISSDSSNVNIDWKKLDNLDESLKAEFNKKFKDVTLGTLPSDGFAFVTAETNVVFVVKGRTEDNKNVTAFIQLKESASNSKELNLLNVKTAEKCYPYFFTWGDKIMMIPTDCDNDRSQKVKDSTDMMTWKASSESFSRLWNVFQDKKGFTTADIDDGSTILFTYNTSASADLDTHLWISDGTRMADVGPIVTKDEGSFSGSILYTNKELFILYKKNTNDQTLDTQKTIVLKRLKDVMSEITRVLNAWKNTDDVVSKLCTENAVSEKYLCVTKFPTNGLVGFLSGKSDNNENIWEDKYLYVNAKVENKKVFANGFTFSGLGSGAEWPVSKEMDYYLYNFAEYGFTLVATVTFDAVEKNIEKNSVMGVGIKSNVKQIGLWCNKDKKWSVNKGEPTSDILTSNKECKDRQRYQVALKLEKRKVSVYVDWDMLSNDQEFAIGESDSISHFYFGANIKKGGVEQMDKSYVTVTNVLLYNRPFNVSEIDELKKNVKPVEVSKSHDDNDNNIPQEDKQQPPTPPPEPIGDKEEKAPSPSRTEDGGVGGGVRVFFLLLAVLCVSAPLLHL